MTVLPYPTWHVIRTTCTTCDSGAEVVVAPGYMERARCGPCILAGVPATGPVTEIAPPPPVRRITGIRVPSGKLEEEDYPAPQVTSRDPWPRSYSAPGPTTDLRAYAESHGWTATLTYSRGCMPHATTGRPGTPRHLVAVRLLHPETGRAGYAIYAVAVKGGAATWDSIRVYGRDRFPFPHCNVTDLREYLAARGELPPAWYKGIHARVMDQKAKAKLAAKSRTAKKESAG